MKSYKVEEESGEAQRITNKEKGVHTFLMSFSDMLEKRRAKDLRCPPHKLIQPRCNEETYVPLYLLSQGRSFM